MESHLSGDRHKLLPHESAILDILKSRGKGFTGTDLFEITEYITGEIKDFFHRKTNKGIFKILDSLCQKGYLTRDYEGGYRLRSEQYHTEIAIVGSITAGSLKEAITDTLGYVKFSGTLPHSDQLFALQVLGDSMIGDQIEHQDCVLLRNAPVLNGQIGAVIVDGETTLKRVYREAGMLRLVPSNPSYKPIHILAENMSSCRVLGRLEAVISNLTGQVTWFTSNPAVSELTLYMN